MPAELKNPVPPQGDTDESYALIRSNQCIPLDEDKYYWTLEIMDHPDTDQYALVSCLR